MMESQYVWKIYNYNQLTNLRFADDINALTWNVNLIT